MCKNLKFLGVVFLSFIIGNCKNKPVKEALSNTELKPVTYTYTELTGIGLEKGITRRDPSDVIKVKDTYYVYYTKVLGQAAGYWGDLWYATSEDEGLTWKEQSQILGVGKMGSFDAQAVFTPNIIKANKKYYLFYTGVKPTPGRTDGVFENNSTTDFTAIGLAIADKPNGPFIRAKNNPLLKVSEDPEKFDSYRVDDAALLVKNEKYLLYYKGRSSVHGANGPRNTQMGVATSDAPEGPYTKLSEPILDKSHEVLIWKQGNGVAALASLSSTLEYSASGLDFTSSPKHIKVSNRPMAPGAFRADLTGSKANTLDWGISMVHNGPDSYLVRYDVSETKESTFEKGTFGYDKDFLQENYEHTIVLESGDRKAQLILSPELQGRVMTSTLNGNNGISFGWLNYDLIASKEIKKQINPTGGEERFWLGPEGGQFSLYFTPNSNFNFENWQVPSALDTEAFNVVSKDTKNAVFQREMHLINHSGTYFDINVTRKITLLDKAAINKNLALNFDDYDAVAYETTNTVKNIGKLDWKKDSGLVSIWLLSMFNPSLETTVIVPVKEGAIKDYGPMVNDNYFGKVPADRLKSMNNTVFFKADGKSRGKIGVSAIRATKFMGSYDAKNEVLTILEIAAPKTNDSYVNSAWEVQKDPYNGDVLNSYNDGPLEDGAQMGPFYELESSSPALTLASDESYTHVQRIYHFKGKKEIINQIAQDILKTSIDEIIKVF